MSQQVPPRLAEMANRQWGLVTRAQALEVLSSSGLRRRLASGVLVVVGRGVYRLAGSLPSWRQRAMAACLQRPGAVVSEHAAAYLWQVKSVAAPTQVQLTLPPHLRSSRVEPRAHRLLLPPLDVTNRWGIPTTTPCRTVIDLSRVVPQPLLERILDDLVRSRHLTISELARRMAGAEPLPRYRKGLLEPMVEVRLARGVGASAREDWVVDTLLAAGVEMPERNVIVEAGGRLYEIDLAYPQLEIGIEYDGLDAHGDARHFHSDREKASVLQLHGWMVLQVTARWTAEELVARVSTALNQRRDPRGHQVTPPW